MRTWERVPGASALIRKRIARLISSAASCNVLAWQCKATLASDLPLPPRFHTLFTTHTHAHTQYSPSHPPVHCVSATNMSRSAIMVCVSLTMSCSRSGMPSPVMADVGTTLTYFLWEDACNNGVATHEQPEGCTVRAGVERVRAGAAWSRAGGLHSVAGHSRQARG